MTIYPTDYVWFTYQGRTQIGRFGNLNPELQKSIDKLYTYKSRKYYWLMFDIYEDLYVHLVLPEKGEKYAKKLHTLFKGSNSRNFSFYRLSDAWPYPDGEVPKFGPLEALNTIQSFSGKKDLALSYVDWICKWLPEQSPKNFEDTRTIKHKPLTCNGELVSNLLRRLKNKQKLEEKPMKVKQYIVELNHYDKKEREFILVKSNPKHNFTTRDILLTLESMYVDSENYKDVLHGILSIGDGRYKIGSGNIEYTEEKAKLVTEGYLDEINLIGLNFTRVYYTEKEHVFGGKGGMKNVSKEIILKTPLKVKVKDVINFYQKKYRNKNYSLTKDSTKKELSERSQKLKDLPQKGETPAKDLRKVCYRHKDGELIHRASLNEVQKLVDSGDFVFVPKAAWKSQLVEKDGTITKIGEANKTNIINPPGGGALGKRKEKRKERDDLRQLKAVRSVNERYRRQAKRKPGDVERKLQSEKDKKAYAEKCKLGGKQRVSHPVSRAYEAIIIDKNGKTLPSFNIKANSIKQAEQRLQTILKFKHAKSGKLTNVRDWIKQTGKNRGAQK